MATGCGMVNWKTWEFPDVDEVKFIIQNETIKREVLESDLAVETNKQLARFLKKQQRAKNKTAPLAEDTTGDRITPRTEDTTGDGINPRAEEANNDGTHFILP